VGEPKTFSKAGLSITLTDNFREEKMDEFTATYESRKVAVLIIKEEFEIFRQGGLSSSMSLNEYIRTINKANNTNHIAKEKDDLTYFEYTEIVGSKNFSYFAVVFRGGDAYWLVQFACETKNYGDMLEQFFEWANTVEV
jgi:hypothetical protein